MDLLTENELTLMGMDMRYNNKQQSSVSSDSRGPSTVLVNNKEMTDVLPNIQSRDRCEKHCDFKWASGRL